MKTALKISLLIIFVFGLFMAFVVYSVSNAYGQEATFSVESWDMSGVQGYTQTELYSFHVDPISNDSAFKIYAVMPLMVMALKEIHIKTGELCYVGRRDVRDGASVMRYFRVPCYQFDKLFERYTVLAKAYIQEHYGVKTI